KWEQEIQTIINRQARTMTGMFRSAPVGVVSGSEGGRSPTGYAYPKQQTTSVRVKIAFDAAKHSYTRYITSNTSSLGQRLANLLVQGMEFDSSFGIEDTAKIIDKPFPGTISIIPDATEAKNFAAEYHTAHGELSFWTDGSKLENQRTGAAVAWKMSEKKWQIQKRHLDRNKGVFDAELYGIDQTLSIELKAGLPRARQSSRATIQRRSQIKKVHVWLDSRAAIARIQHLAPGPGQ
ncbi:hypothetical protein EPUL_005018, partial [Erysiphe pulchra]